MLIRTEIEWRTLCVKREKKMFAEREVRPTRKEEMRKVEVTQCFLQGEGSKGEEGREKRERDGESRRTNSKGEEAVVLWKGFGAL